MKLESLARSVISVSPEASVVEAIETMVENNVSAVAVARDGAMEGIFTLRDVARKVVLAGLDPDATAVGEVMTRDIKCAMGGDDVRDALRTMLEFHIHHLPVVGADGRVEGIVSFQYLLRDKIESLAFEAETLGSYIRNNGYA